MLYVLIETTVRSTSANFPMSAAIWNLDLCLAGDALQACGRGAPVDKDAHG